MHIFLAINDSAHVPHNEEVLEILSIQVKEIESNSSASECADVNVGGGRCGRGQPGGMEGAWCRGIMGSRWMPRSCSL